MRTVLDTPSAMTAGQNREFALGVQDLDFEHQPPWPPAALAATNFAHQQRGESHFARCFRKMGVLDRRLWPRVRPLPAIPTSESRKPQFRRGLAWQRVLLGGVGGIGNPAMHPLRLSRTLIMRKYLDFRRQVRIPVKRWGVSGCLAPV